MNEKPKAKNLKENAVFSDSLTLAERKEIFLRLLQDIPQQNTDHIFKSEVPKRSSHD